MPTGSRASSQNNQFVLNLDNVKIGYKRNDKITSRDPNSFPEPRSNSATLNPDLTVESDNGTSTANGSRTSENLRVNALLNLILQLHCHTGLPAFFENLVNIFESHFGAERLCLALPTDPTDIQNAPWGLKALWDRNSRDKSIEDRLNCERPAPHFETPDSLPSHIDIQDHTPAIPISKTNTHILDPIDIKNIIPSGYLLQPTGSGDSYSGLSRQNSPAHPREPLSADARDSTVRHATLNQNSIVFEHLAPLEIEEDPLIDMAGVVSLLNHSQLTVLLQRKYELIETPSKERVVEPGFTGDRSPMSDHRHELKRAFRFYDSEQVPVIRWFRTPTASPVLIEYAHSPFFRSSDLEDAFQTQALSDSEEEPPKTKEAPLSEPDTDNKQDHHPPEKPSRSKCNDQAESQKPQESAEFEDTFSIMHIKLLVALPLQRPNGPSVPIGVLSFISSLVPYPHELHDTLTQLTPHIASAFRQALAHFRLSQRLKSDLETQYACDSFNFSPRPSLSLETRRNSCELVSGFPTTPSNEPSSVPQEPSLLKVRTELSPFPSPSSKLEASQEPTSSRGRTAQVGNLSAGVMNPDLRRKLENDLVYEDVQLKQELHRDRLRRSNVSTPTSANYPTVIQTRTCSPDTAADLGSQSCDGSKLSLSQRLGACRHSSRLRDRWSFMRETQGSANVGPRNDLDPHNKAEWNSYSKKLIDEKLSNGSRSGLRRNYRSSRRWRVSRHILSRLPLTKRLHRRSRRSGAILAHIRHRPNTNTTLPHGKSRGTFVESNTIPSQRLLRTIMDAIPVHVYTMEPVSLRVTWVSNRTLAYRGQTAKEFKSDPTKSIHPADVASYESAWTRVRQKGEPLGQLLQVRRFDGKYRIFFLRVVPLRDDIGVIRYWFFTMMDIHSQRQSELEAYAHLEDTLGDHKYKILAESAPIIVFTTNLQRGMMYANKKWFDYSGLTPAETYGFQYLVAVHPDDRERSMIPITMKSRKRFTGGYHSRHGSAQILRTSDAQPRLRDIDDGIYSVEIRLLNRDRQYRWHLVRFTCWDREYGRSEDTWCGTCTDIHDQKLIQEKLKEAKDAAQRTIESKTWFLSNMSHEIRTPLIGISGMVSFLLNTNLTEEQLDYCHTISSSAEALLMVINDILDLSKVESGKMTLAREWFHVRRLVEETHEFLGPLALAKNLELNYIVEPKVPPFVKGDRVRLRQVMLNIIGNAIKFTDKGEIFTICSMQPYAKGANSVKLHFEVHDTGRGFTSEDEKRMFKPFSQASKTYSTPSTADSESLRKENDQQVSQSPQETVAQIDQQPAIQDGLEKVKMEESSGPTTNLFFESGPSLGGIFDRPLSLPHPAGTGLGLVISRQLIELHGGRLTCEGIKNVGSKFFFDCKVGLPTSSDKPSEEQQEREEDTSLSQATPTHEKWTILLICPYQFARRSMAHHIEYSLGSQPYEIISYNGEADITKRVWTHIVINCVMLSEVIQRIKQFAYAAPRIIVLTTSTQRVSIQVTLPEYLERVTFLFKPLKASRYALVFDPSQQQASSKDMKMQSAYQIARTHKDVFKQLLEFTQDKQLKILLAEDNLVNQKVMSKFLEKSGLLCDIASDGMECVNKVLEKGSRYYNLILVSFKRNRFFLS